MANNFLHEESGVNTIISDINSALLEYKDEITALKQLVDEMCSSSAWKDDTVKTSFINTAKAYLTSYDKFSAGIEGYVSCLKTKSENITENEANFS